MTEPRATIASPVLAGVGACAAVFVAVFLALILADQVRAEGAVDISQTGRSAEHRVEIGTATSMVPADVERSSFVLSIEQRATVGALAAESTVKVVVTSCQGVTIGSGFGLGALAVTNRHVLEGAIGVEIRQQGYETIEYGPDATSLVALDDEQDLGVIGPFAGLSLVLGQTRPVAGDEVVLAGHPEGGDLVVLTSSIHRIVDGSPYGLAGSVMLLDTETSPGFSGGPVLNHQGHVVGVLQGFDRTTGLTLAIPLQDLAVFYQPLQVGISPGDAVSAAWKESDSCESQQG